MEYVCRAVFVKEFRYTLSVAQIALLHAECSRRRRRAETVWQIKANNIPTLCLNEPGQMRADETLGPSNKCSLSHCSRANSAVKFPGRKD